MIRFFEVFGVKVDQCGPKSRSKCIVGEPFRHPSMGFSLRYIEYLGIYIYIYVCVCVCVKGRASRPYRGSAQSNPRHERLKDQALFGLPLCPLAPFPNVRLAQARRPGPSSTQDAGQVRKAAQTQINTLGAPLLYHLTGPTETQSHLSREGRSKDGANVAIAQGMGSCPEWPTRQT